MEKSEQQILYNRFIELAQRSYSGNIFTFSDFLSQSEQDVLFQASHEFSHVKFALFGGYESAERKVARFGDPEDLGYEVDYPISCIKIEPLAKKFAKEYSHRDYLGSLMNLGLERKVFGDIYIDGMTAYIYALEKSADYVMENLSSVGRNSVKCSISTMPEELVESRKQTLTIQCSSMRADGIICHTYNLSRKDVLPYFMEKKVAVNGHTVENNDKQIAEGDVISVRGFGKFRVAALGGISKKGKQHITIEKYI